jgi:alkylation response protein AidB-like acyl-CoA dehydrogenase
LAVAADAELQQRWLPGLANGKFFATVGISHLTTSRQHTAPAVAATVRGNGYRLTGDVPWVTGAGRAHVIVAGGTLPDGRQILTAIPTDRPSVTIDAPLPLLALTGSETGPIRLTDVEVAVEEVIFGPVEGVVAKASTGGAGSLMTSTLAAGHAWGCLDHLQREAARRTALAPVVQALMADAQALRGDLLGAARGGTASAEELRTRATDLALRASQALLTATKGAGFLAGHPAERLSRQALFFLVWSCPQAVANQLLQSFGGCDNE